MRKTLAALISAAFIAGMSIAPASAVTFGGEIIDASVSKPWVVSIWYAKTTDADSVPICTGSLIAPDVVLTAAHCVLSTGYFYVQTHADTLVKSTYKFHEVNSSWKSPRYSAKRLINDFGLLKLTEPIEDITPIPFAKSTQLKNSDALRSFKLYGWGVNQDGDEANFLGTAILSNQTSAAAKLFKSDFNSKTMIAAGKYISKERVYAGACNGDSGGPLVGVISGVETVVGVTSFGKTGCNFKAPSIFTKVAYFSKDITAGLAAVRKGSVVSNRAAPIPSTAPGITGVGAVGSTLTCDKGIWSANTTKVSLRWTSPASIVGLTDPQVLVKQEHAGQTFTCEVTGISTGGTKTVRQSVPIPIRPTSRSTLTISGVYAIYPPVKIGDSISCSGMAWGEGVTETITWYSSSTNQFSLSNPIVGSGKTLTVDLALGEAIAGRYLQCLSTGTSAGGSSSYYASVQVAKPTAPVIWSVSISGLTSGTLAPAAGAVGSCTYQASEQGVATFQWVITNNTYPSTVLHTLGSSATQTITSDIISKLSGNYLECRVNVRSIGGSANGSKYVWYLFALPNVPR